MMTELSKTRALGETSARRRRARLSCGLLAALLIPAVFAACNDAAPTAPTAGQPALDVHGLPSPGEQLVADVLHGRGQAGGAGGPTLAVQGGAPGSAAPVPIAGGLEPAPGLTIHAWTPANHGLSPDAEPNVITNVNGLVGLTYQRGTATDADGNTYDLQTDMRFFKGEYVSMDGTHHRGTFVFI